MRTRKGHTSLYVILLVRARPFAEDLRCAPVCHFSIGSKRQFRASTAGDAKVLTLRSTMPVGSYLSVEILGWGWLNSPLRQLLIQWLGDPWLGALLAELSVEIWRLGC